MSNLTELFSMLSDATRVHLLLSLADEEKNVTTLCEELALPQPTVSHHLGLLRMAGLASPRRDGKQIFYSLAAGISVSKAKGKSTIEFATDDGRVRVARPA
jgi:DNA-binding transcriptional ArsR family regulator